MTEDEVRLFQDVYSRTLDRWPGATHAEMEAMLAVEQKRKQDARRQKKLKKDAETV